METHTANYVLSCFMCGFFLNWSIIKWKSFKQSYCISEKLIFILPICHFYNIQKLFNFDDFTNKNNTEHNLKSPYIPDHSYRNHDKSSIALP